MIDLTKLTNDELLSQYEEIPYNISCEIMRRLEFGMPFRREDGERIYPTDEEFIFAMKTHKQNVFGDY